MADIHPPLTILEEFLLLALDDRAGQFYPLARSTFDCAAAGAVLMDLTLRHRIDNDLRDMFVTDATPTGNPIFDPVLQLNGDGAGADAEANYLLAAGNRRHWRSVTRKSPATIGSARDFKARKEEDPLDVRRQALSACCIKRNSAKLNCAFWASYCATIYRNRMILCW